MAKAAKQIATTGAVADTPQGPSLVVQGGLLVLLTVAALGVGWLSGSYLKAESVTEASQEEKPAAAAGGGHGEPATADASTASEKPLLVVPLEPITTNLAAPSETWIRLEASIVLDGPTEEPVAEQVHQDLLAFVRTLKMHQVEGASGFQHLKADLEERAALRSAGHVKNVLIRTLLFE